MLRYPDGEVDGNPPTYVRFIYSQEDEHAYYELCNDNDGYEPTFDNTVR